MLVDDGGHSVGTSFFANAGGASYGPLALPEALKVSSDDFFYQLGEMANNGQEIQEWAAKYGFGKPTGVDLPGELGGLIPTPEWRNDLYDEGLTDRPWSVGDNINFSIGQGDLQATPLQMAVAYAAIANGGTVVQPHLGMRIEGADGEPIQELEHDGARELDIDPEHRSRDPRRAAPRRQRARAAPRRASSRASRSRWPARPAPRRRGSGRADQSWYAALAPYPDPKYVVVATFEAGGFGAETAAPAVREILAALFEVNDDGRRGRRPTAID